MDFSVRHPGPEILDGDGVDYPEYRAVMADLSKVNRFTLAYGPTLGFLERLRREGRLPKDRPLEVLDVGFGYGDMLRRIERWAKRKGVAVALTGVDLNPWAAETAGAATQPGSAIRWLTGDAYALGQTDVVISALFTHHLNNQELVRFLAWSEARSRLGWFVNDLHRHPLAHALFGPLCRVMGWRPIVRIDGLTSIRRAFTAGDWRAYLALAGIPDDAVEIRWRLLFRLCLARVKP